MSTLRIHSTYLAADQAHIDYFQMHLKSVPSICNFPQSSFIKVHVGTHHPRLAKDCHL